MSLENLGWSRWRNAINKIANNNQQKVGALAVSTSFISYVLLK